MKSPMMPVLTWFFRFISCPLGLACFFVSFDMLYVWGLEGRSSRRRPPRPSASRRSSSPGAYRASPRGVVDTPDHRIGAGSKEFAPILIPGSGGSGKSGDQPSTCSSWVWLCLLSES